MSVAKTDVVKLFQESSRFGKFKTAMVDLNFEFNTRGCNKYVFINPKVNWVAKVVYGRPDTFPSSKSKIAEYFVWPELVKRFQCPLSSQKYELCFQERVDCSNQEKAYKELMETFKDKGIYWTKDNHDWNVGYYKGRPVIFDF